jgi:hypothetical protein
MATFDSNGEGKNGQGIQQAVLQEINRNFHYVCRPFTAVFSRNFIHPLGLLSIAKKFASLDKKIMRR